MELAALGLKVEGIDNVDKAASSLDNLAASAKGAEKATQGVGTGSKQAAPQVDALSQASAKAARDQAKLQAQAQAAGMSVGQLSAALRNVPAQFTDIAVSLQGGMSPLTVFMQQGGQLKDMFGGAGPAARALGGYIMGLITPMSLAAAGVAALGLAYYQGSKEADTFRLSLITTGNAAGLTVSQLQGMASAISETTGTTSAAAAALATMVSAGVRAESELAKYTETAIRWAKYTGEGVEVVAERFVALQKEPVSAALKLNETTNFLTESVYKQIKALDEQGDTAGAARVAMDAYNSAMEQGAKQIEQNLGYVERAWNAAGGAAKWAWDQFLSIGRQDSLTERLSDIDAELEKLSSRSTKAVELRKKSLQSERAELVAKAEAESKAAESSKEQAEAVKALSDFDKKYKDALKEQLPLEKVLANARAEAVKFGKSEAEIKKILAFETEKYNKANKKPKGGGSSGVSELANIQARVIATNQYIKALQEQGAAADKITEGERLAYKIQLEIDSGRLSSSQLIQKQKELEAAKALQSAEEQVKAEQQRIAMVERAQKAYADSLNSQMDMEQRLAAQRRQYGADSATAGMGSRSAAEFRQRFAIEQKHLQDIAAMRMQHGQEMRAAENEAERAQLASMFEQRLADTKAFQEQDLALYDQHLLAKREREANWMLGVQESLQTYLENSRDLYAIAAEQVMGLTKTAEQAISSNFMSMLDGSKSVGDAMRDMAQSMTKAIVQALIDMAAQWLVYQGVQLLVGKTTAAAGAAGVAANANAQALTAGIAAFASTAAIPIVGPALAPAAMGSALAVTMPMAQAVSALSLAGMAHDGIDSIPATGTWLLEKGERVTTANTSARLDSTLERIDSRMNQNGGNIGSSPKVTVQLIGGEFQNAQVEEDYDSINEETIIRVVSNDIARRGPITQAGTQYLGWSRVGT